MRLLKVLKFRMEVSHTSLGNLGPWGTRRIPLARSDRAVSSANLTITPVQPSFIFYGFRVALWSHPKKTFDSSAASQSKLPAGLFPRSSLLAPPPPVSKTFPLPPSHHHRFKFTSDWMAPSRTRLVLFVLSLGALYLLLRPFLPYSWFSYATRPLWDSSEVRGDASF